MECRGSRVATGAATRLPSTSTQSKVFENYTRHLSSILSYQQWQKKLFASGANFVRQRGNHLKIRYLRASSSSMKSPLEAAHQANG
jgi:hypothetical protein